MKPQEFDKLFAFMVVAQILLFVGGIAVAVHFIAKYW